MSEALVDPAIATLRKRGADILFNRRITGLVVQQRLVAALGTNDGPLTLDADDCVVLAVPPWAAQELLPDMTVPNAFESILNLHIPGSPCKPLPTSPRPGSLAWLTAPAEWIFVRHRLRVSITVSAANKLMDRPADELAAAIWLDVAVKALDLSGQQADPARHFGSVKERRATIVANPCCPGRTPPRCTDRDAESGTGGGDWTDTRLPGTIEGAIRSAA